MAHLTDLDLTAPADSLYSGGVVLNTWRARIDTLNDVLSDITSVTAAGRALLDDADAAAQRTTLGLGSIATQAASSVAITGGTVDGITSLSISGTAILTSGEQLLYINCPSETVAGNAAWITLKSTVTSGDLTGIRSRVYGNAASAGANVRGGYFEAKMEASKYAAMLEGSLSHADYSAGSIIVSGDVRGFTAHISQGAGLEAANLYGGHINIQTRGDETITTDDVGLLIRNEAVGGAGRTMDAALKVVDLNMGGGTDGFTYGIDLYGTGIATADIRLSGGLVLAATATLLTMPALALVDVTMSLGSDADGDIYYRSSNKLVRLAKGTEDYVLTMGAAVPEWAAAGAGAGDITGPDTSTDHAIPRWHETGGDELLDSGITISDANVLAIGAGTLDVSGGTLTLATNQISGDKVEGGTIAAITITALTAGVYTLPSTDGTLDQLLKTDGAGALSWTTIAAGGDVEGPASATDNAIAKYHLTTGKVIQNSGVTIDDSNIITCSGLVLNGNISTITAARSWTMIDNTTSALMIMEGATSYLRFNTNDGLEKIILGKKLEAGAVEIEGSAFDINGGYIDNTVVGNGNPSTGSFTCLSLRSVGELRFFDDGNYVGFEAPALDANQIWVLPSADGAADTVLKTDGSGNLSWVSAPGANAALSNLASVAINESLISDTDNTDDLGSAAKEWKDLYIDGTANIDSLVADTADINAGTVDAITSLTAAGDLDIGAHDLRAATLTADGMAADKIVTTTTNGQLTDANAIRFDNLCRNAVFASRSGGTSVKPDEWTLEGTPTVAYDTVDPGYGDYAVKVTATGAADEGIYQTLTHLKVSTTYQVFARVKVTDGDTASLITTGATTNINVDSTSATWENISGEFTTDASGTDVVIKLVASADTDVAYFCGITCVEGDVNPLNFIRRVNETIWLPASFSDTSWDGDAFSSVEDDLDLSAFGGGCPLKIKAVYISVGARDSGSSGANCFIFLGIGGVAINAASTKTAVGLSLQGESDDAFKIVSGWCPCDSNGDIRYDIEATGESTFDVWLGVWGYVLGE